MRAEGFIYSRIEDYFLPDYAVTALLFRISYHEWRLSMLTEDGFASEVASSVAAPWFQGLSNYLNVSAWTTLKGALHSTTRFILEQFGVNRSRPESGTNFIHGVW